MKNDRKRFVGLSIILLMGGGITAGLTSCAVEDFSVIPPETVEWSDDSGTPYATVEELDAVTNLGDEYVYWRVARAFALIELESFRDEMEWEKSKISDTPVIVYDSKSCPKYYEFRVIRDDVEIGSITAIAQKKDGKPTAYVLPVPSDYSELITKGSGYRVIANNYPHFVYGLVNKAGEEITTAVDGEGNEVELEIDYLQLALDHPEYFTNAYLTESMIIENINAIQATNDWFWDVTYDYFSNFVILSTNDSLFEEFYTNIISNEQDNNNRVITSTYSSPYYINNQICPDVGEKDKNGWWDIDYVKGATCLNWISSPYTIHGCGPSATAMALTYYGYTNKIKVIELYQTNYLIPKGTEFYDYSYVYTNFGAGNAPVTYTEYIYDDGDTGMIVDQVDVNVIINKPSSAVLSKSIQKISNGYRVDITVLYDYNIIYIDFDIKYKFTNSDKRYGYAAIKGSFNKTKLIGISYNKTGQYDGYYVYTEEIGVKREEGGTTSWGGLIAGDPYGLKWASDNQLLSYRKHPFTELGNQSFIDAKAAIDRGDLFLLSRSGWRSGSENGRINDAHVRLGVGYKINCHFTIEKGYHWKWVSLFKFIKEYYTITKYFTDSYWYLIIDNGYESDFNDPAKDGNRDYLNNGGPYNSYLENIFYENKDATGDYFLTEMIVIQS